MCGVTAGVTGVGVLPLAGSGSQVEFWHGDDPVMREGFGVEE